MKSHRFDRLLRLGITEEATLQDVLEKAALTGAFPDEMLVAAGVPKHEVLFSLSEFHGCPFVEFDESIMASYFITMRLSLEKHKQALWFPLSVKGKQAEIIAYRPEALDVLKDIKLTLGVEEVNFIVALPSDLMRIIEHNFDVNPAFPAQAGRTPLAKVRTFFADRRSLFACNRTVLAKGRTGLAFLRTGISFITISLVVMRVFHSWYLLPFALTLLISGVVMTVDGTRWYLPARKQGQRPIQCASTDPTWGSTVLKLSNPGNNPVFTRSEAVTGAEELRKDWTSLSPVMRRRFLASDRTDFAEERTVLACYRTGMARARTGLAFARTGVAMIGTGLGLLRQFKAGPWTAFDIVLIATGTLMAMEGIHWYLPGRSAGTKGFLSVVGKQEAKSIWDFMLPPVFKSPEWGYMSPPPVKPSHAPGIWATTGLALERTVLADRRNVMARLRTVMARSRTGMALIRTGMAISATGMGLQVYFSASSVLWTAFNVLLILIGLTFIADGLLWQIPAERIRQQLPYCFGDMEITVPEYGKPARYWGKAVFTNDNN